MREPPPPYAMALLAAIGLALLLMVVTLAVRPAAILAATGPAPSSATAGAKRTSAAARPPARAEAERQTLGVPRLGKASNPYDMEALRNFDAGSHR